jgi:two-component system, NarL family, response regulator DevR
MAAIKILVVDDHGIVREGLKMVLSLEADFAVVGEAASGKEAVDQALRLRPDVVLMDVLMDEVNGIDACRQIKSALPDIKVLMLTSHDAAQAVEASVLAGASGYLLKNGGREDLLKGIRAVAQGESLLSPRVTAQVLERFASLTRKERERENDLLSEQEKEVLVLVARGLTNRQIAAELIISENTVRNHLSHILDKLDLSRRSQVAAYAAQHGLLPHDDQREQR